MNDKEKTPCIGIMIGNYHSDHARRLVKHLYDLVEKEKLNAHFYLGTESSSFLTEFAMHSNRYDYQYASLYGLSKYDRLDALIVSVGTQSIYQGAVEVRTFLDSLPDLPMILTETTEMPKKGAHLITDNYGGIRSIVEHLIKVHNLTKIAFLGGPRTGNVDGAERLAAYLDTMRENGLECEENLIRHGDYSEHVDELVEELLDQNPALEAIVCANDEMAISAYRVCEKRNLTVGHDIAVTGFDDMELASLMSPPLTTAAQDYQTMSEKAMEKTLAMLRGEEVESEKIPSPFIRRSSCCCPITDPKMIDAIFRWKERGTLISNVWKMHDKAHHSWVSAMITRDLLQDNTNRRQFFDRLGTCFHMIKTRSSLIALFENPRRIEEGCLPPLPEYMLLYLSQQGDHWKAYGETDAEKIPLVALSDPAGESIYEDGSYMIFLLFYENIQYGIMSVRIAPEDIEFYYTLSLEIGTALRYLTLSLAHQEYQNELQSVARHDNLTGLYNRLGFLNAATGYTFEHRDKTMVALMADLDHLKQINDTFGHVEGDFAIKKCADYLCEALDADGLLGRTGGDEFMGMFAISDPAEIEDVKQRIADLASHFNETSDKPYYVELSVGCVPFSYREYDSYNDLIRMADDSLYEAKKVRRASVVK